MIRLKLFVIFLFTLAFVSACLNAKPTRYIIADSKAYEASLFRQYCAVCHGPEGEGKTLDDGKLIPNMREGELKFKTETEIFKQITNGGNGMTPFRDQLTTRESLLMAAFVHDKLRKQN